MNTRRFWVCSTVLPMCLSVGATANSAGADTLVAKLHSDEALLYELLVVDVEVHLEEPFLLPEELDDAHEANRQLMRLRRRLTLELRHSGGQKVSSGILILTFPRPTSSTRMLAGTGFALLGKPDRKTDDFQYWTHPGKYTSVVVDNERGLESNAMLLSIVMPRGASVEAAEIFRHCALDTLMLLADEELRGTESAKLFQRLATGYPETPYGRYALASLALMRYRSAFAKHNNRGGASVWAPVAVDLRRAVEAFDGRHPIREKLLFRLAVAQALAGDREGSRRTAQTVFDDFPSGNVRMKTQQLVSELDALEEKERKNKVEGKNDTND